MKRIFVLFLVFMLAFLTCFVLSVPASNTLKADGTYQWVPINNGLTNLHVFCLAIDPTNTSTIYAGTDGGIFKSTNRGNSWIKMENRASNFGGPVYPVYSIAIDPTNTQLIYAGANGVFKSADGGNSWIKMEKSAEFDGSVLWGPIDSFAIDPTNTQVVYAGTYRVFKSTDGGNSWTQRGLTYGWYSVDSLAINPTNTQIIYAGTDGVFKSIDGGNSWGHMNSGFTDAHVYSLAIDPTNTQVIYAGTDGGIFKSTNRGYSWVQMNSGFTDAHVYSLAIDPTNTQVIYAGTDGGVFKSIDGGNSWLNMNSGLAAMQVNSLAIDPTNTSNIYAGIDGGVFKYVKPYTITTSAGVGGTISPSKTVLISPSFSQTFTITPNAGYQIKNVLVDGNSVGAVSSYTFTNIKDNHSVEAIFEINTYTITASAGTGGAISPPGTVGINQGTDQSFTITPDAGYQIKNVLVDGNSVGAVSSYTFTNITSNHTIKAIFEIKTYTITTSEGTGGAIGGTISPPWAVGINQGTDQSFTITPDAGYHIKDIKVDGISIGAVSSYTFTNIKDNHSIEAIFEINTYTIIILAGPGGTISPSDTITVNSGESKTFTITPNTGYKISSVKVDGVSVGAVSTYTFTNVTASHTISATFEKQILQKVIILQIGKTSFTVNGIPNTLDSPPVIKNSRTLLPIRAIIESLGGTVSWDATERKVTVNLGSNTIELWIGKNAAKVNGVDTPIDSSNSKVVPEIINSRTMLPLRFIAENLGATVDWNGTTKTITITYQAP